MKKAFALATVSVWTLGLLIGIGFGVVGHVNATNKLPLENRQLVTENRSLAMERDSLVESVKSETARGDQYFGVLGMQNKMLLKSVALPDVAYLGPWPKED